MFPGNLNPVAFRLNSLLSLVHVIIFHDCYVIDHQVAPWRQNSPHWLEKCVLWQEHLGGLVKVLPWCWPRQEPLCILQVSLTFQEIVLWFDKSSVKGSSLKDAERCVLLEHFDRAICGIVPWIPYPIIIIYLSKHNVISPALFQTWPAFLKRHYCNKSSLLSSKTLKMQAFLFLFLMCAHQMGIMVPGVPSGDRGNWGLESRCVGQHITHSTVHLKFVKKA